MNVMNKTEYRERALKVLQSFTLMDDTFMTSVFDNNIEATNYLVNTILERNDIVVTEVTTQDSIPNLYGRGVRLDIRAKDSKWKYYDIEVQNSNDGAVPERARFNSALLDTHITESGKNYSSMPETYVIFITKNDILNGGLAKYAIERTILELNRPFNDKAHIIYINGSKSSDDSIGRLIHDFNCSDYRDMYSDVLAERVKFLKRDEKGVKKMCEKMEKFLAEIREDMKDEVRNEVKDEVRNEVKDEVRNEVKDENAATIAVRMWTNGVQDMNLIATSVDLPLSKVAEIIEDLQTNSMKTGDSLKKLEL